MAKLSRKSDTTVAILYTLKRWEAFVRYAGDGQLEIDNNSAERAARRRIGTQEFPLRRRGQWRGTGRGDVHAHRNGQAQ